MRKNTLTTLLVVLLITLCAPHNMAYGYSKQSMSLTVGSKNLTFEAPRGKCFADNSSPFGKSMHEQLGDLHNQIIEKVLLVIILDCNDISGGAGTQATANATTIYWLNPVIGDVLDITKKQYFDVYEDYIDRNDYFGNKKLVRTDNFIARYSENTIKNSFEETKSFTATASTLIKNLPLEIITKSNNENTDLGYEQEDMEDFINLQIQINE